MDYEKGLLFDADLQKALIEKSVCNKDGNLIIRLWIEKVSIVVYAI